jgi:hypothetical protein
MKKIAIVLMFVMVSSNSIAFEDLQATSHTILNDQPTTFLDTTELINEYSSEKDNERDIEEYDQNITDKAISPKVNRAEAMLKEILGTLLVRYISLRETASAYLKEAQNAIIQWYHRIVKT